MSEIEFSVVLGSNREGKSVFDGTEQEVCEWLSRQSITAIYEVYNPSTGSYGAASGFLQPDPSTVDIKFAVVLRRDRDVGVFFAKAMQETTEWLAKQPFPGIYEVLNTQTSAHHVVGEFLTDQKPEPEFVSKYYQMDPETEDLVICGEDLMDGMVVLFESSENRQNTDHLDIEWQIEKAMCRNRWCTVSNIASLDGEEMRFVGTYEDGTKRLRVFGKNRAWLAKLDSIKAAKSKHEKVTALVKEAMLLQDAATYHENRFDTGETAAEFAVKIVEVL